MVKLRELFNKTALHDEAQARKVCEQSCAAHPDLPRLKTIAAVGAYDAEIGGKAEDSRRLTAVMGYLLRSGFLIDPDFSIDVVNFSNGRDFLKERTQVDLVFVSFILAQHLRSTYIYDENVRRMARVLPANPDPWFHLSPIFGCALSRHHGKEEWRERLLGCVPKMAVTYGGQQEISTQILCADENAKWLAPLINTPSFKVSDFSTRRADSTFDKEGGVNIRKLYKDATADVPLPWLGFAGSKDYVRATQDSLSRTMLARRARALIAA